MEYQEPPDARVTVDSPELQDSREKQGDLASQADPVLTELTDSPDVTGPRGKLVCMAVKDLKDPLETQAPPETPEPRDSLETKEPL